ncbi:MAG TPA: hypothetical protein DCW83_03070 [Saprospirales bacterium]|jgi:outer membrane protein insertion porin family|nr:hypothetical protein [Saprospirales bacterium]HAW03638.1 hypothetical protein [Saprospirales bacterium]
MTTRYSENIYYCTLALLLVVMVMSSCNPGKHLLEGQSLLEENKVTLKAQDKIENEWLLKNELNSFIAQETNGTIIGFIPQEWIYMINDDEDDTKWYNNFARKYLGTPPVIYDHFTSEETAASMEKFLRNKKGFYDANVSVDSSNVSYKTYVEYIIDANRRYYINSISYIGKDTNMVNIIKGMQSNSLIKVGDPLNATAFDLEKTRIVNKLQNEGYANFAPNYIDIKGDSTGLDHKVDMFIEIYPPAPGKIHKRYSVGDVNIYTDYFRGATVDGLYSQKIGKYTYLGKNKDFLVKPSALSYRVFIEPGNVVKKDDRLKTFKGLSGLSSYRFVSMNPSANMTSDTIINFDIFLTAYQNIWIGDYGADIFYSSISVGNKDIIGYSLSTTFDNRNAFGGSENYSIGLEYGQELELNPFDTRTISLSLQNSLQIPREVNLLGMSSILRAMRLVSADGLKSFKEQAQTNIEGGVRIQRIKEFLDEEEIGVSFGYSFNPNLYTRYNIRQTSFNLNLAEIKPKLLIQIGNNPAIINSFEDYLITSLFFRDITFSKQSKVSQRGYSWAFAGYFGQSGLETWLANKAYNGITGNETLWLIKGVNDREDVNFAKFTKVSFDIRGKKELSKKSEFASRLFLGVVNPFGGEDIVPFREQFGVGGPTSLRGWEQSEIGPGGYSKLLIAPDPDQLFYQKGDIRLELNLEYRFDIFKVPFFAGKLEGAIFTDAGNIWLLKADGFRDNAEISGDFHKQIAVAGGWGLRFDFDFFLIRFDFGYKLRNTYPDPNDGGYWRSFKEIRSQGTLGFGNLQIGVGYAF